MRNAGGRPRAVQDAVRIGLTIPRDVDAAIDTLVAASGGVSKATFVRQALLAGLTPYGLVSAEMAAALTPTTYRERNRDE